MLGTVSSTFQDLDCDETLLITTLYRLMLKSCYQKKNAHSLANTLLSMLWHNRLLTLVTKQQYGLLKALLI